MLGFPAKIVADFARSRHDRRWIAWTARRQDDLEIYARRLLHSRDDLVTRAYGDEHVITERTVDSHVRRIRQKLAAVGVDVLETVYGVGYRLREEPP